MRRLCSGNVILTSRRKGKKRSCKVFLKICKEENLGLIGWREVPTNPSILGKASLEAMPYIMQVL